MILRRLMQHVREQNWFAVAMDFVIVVLGVVLGFQISQWNSDRAASAYERAALLRLHEEAEAAVGYLELIDQIYQESNALRSEALARLTARDFEGADMVALSRGVRVTTLLPAASTPRGTYDEILNAGLLSTIGDDALRRALANFYADQAFLESQIGYFRQIVLGRPHLASFDEVQIIFAPGTDRERDVIIDLERAAENPAFIEHLLLGNNTMRAIADWWGDAVVSARALCAETARLTGEPCEPYLETAE